MMCCSLFIQIALGHDVILMCRLRNLGGSEDEGVESGEERYTVPGIIIASEREWLGKDDYSNREWDPFL